MAKSFRFTRLASLNDIPTHHYEGYYWLSNASEPAVVESESLDLSEFETDGKPCNPFIVESNLYCSEEGISISVRHSDGCYLISLIEWSGPQECELNVRSFRGHAGFGDRRLRFREAWIKKEDEFCENLPVLVPAVIGFIGFESGERYE